ncbi:MAG TPA: alpha/beta fold hydrolase, partial [Steroidobacteraceae bacterium]|nr:alpha/beta fold hydrolase [Steroidobacteraceae bacterium]
MPTASVNGTAICYRTDGPAGAPVLVLSASLGTHHGMWDAQLPALARRLQVLRYDTRGHGASAVPRGPYDLAMLGRDVLGLLDSLGIER